MFNWKQTTALAFVCPVILAATSMAMSDQAEKGWLGVQVGEVPEALAAHFELEGTGVIVTNVVEDGPADKAGIKRHDVIVSVNSRKLPPAVEEAVAMIASNPPGTEVDLGILRSGRKRTVTVEMGKPGGEVKAPWRFNFSPQVQFEDRINLRGRILSRDDEGNWFSRDLGDLGDLEAFSKLGQFFPKPGTRSFTIRDGKRQSVKILIGRDGETMSIEQEDEGKIILRRTDKGGKETVTEYENADALKADDEEAYKTYENLGSGSKYRWSFGGAGNFEGKSWPSFTAPNVKMFRTDPDELGFSVDTVIFEKQFATWQKSIGDFRKSQEKAMKGLEGFRTFQFAPGDGFWGTSGPGLAAQFGKPKQTFKVTEDGKIEVRIRSGDSELVQLFKDEDDLADRKPDLHKKYKELMALDKESKKQ